MVIERVTGFDSRLGPRNIFLSLRLSLISKQFTFKLPSCKSFHIDKLSYIYLKMSRKKNSISFGGHFKCVLLSNQTAPKNGSLNLNLKHWVLVPGPYQVMVSS